ncbi:MAG: NADH-quinone oxidoreductase subunit NuoG [Bacteroidales bacterium]|nr:NADH-quinone oxidoreductase subunit NuoG [Bacteroidales bacterium]
MVNIYIDGIKYQAEEGKNLLDYCLSVGLDIPYFCFHPAMGSVGACRLCAVKMYKDENDTRGKIIMSCVQPVQDGMIISIEDPEVKHFRAQVIESLMNNHPHDCPICDEGGECHLQDMTVMTGHVYRRNRFKKRTYRNQYLGPFINHEMNRCIQCYRCTRFYREYAGGYDLDVFGIHSRVFFGRHQDGMLENEFSGNLVEVCPTGVFTDKTLKKHYTRKWDLSTAPSICEHCSLGCNTIPGERYGKLRRIRNRYNYDVNGYFLCDRGRFGYEYVNRETRIKKIKARFGAELQDTTEDEILDKITNAFEKGKTLGIGSARASVEANYALNKLVGAENFYAGISGKDHQILRNYLDILRNYPVNVPSMKETEEADYVLVLGEDITHSAPRLALSLRQTLMKKAMDEAARVSIPRWLDHAVREFYQDGKAPMTTITPYNTKLDDVASKSLRLNPHDTVKFGFLLANRINNDAPAVKDYPGEWDEWLDQLAKALINAKKPLIVSGWGNGLEEMLKAAANITQALNGEERKAGLFYALPEANSMGLGLLEGNDLSGIMETGDAPENLIILENDLYRHFDKVQADKFFNQFKNILLIDHTETNTTDHASFVLPSGVTAESSGTFINTEGRAQRFYKAYIPEAPVMDSWRWLGRIENHLKKTGGQWNSLDECLAELVKGYTVFKPLTELAPPSGFRINGEKVARAPHRYTGRTSMHAHKNVHEQKPPQDEDAPMSFTMEGYNGTPPSSLVSHYWKPGWNSVQALNKYQQEVGGPMHDGDPGKRVIEPTDNPKQQYFKVPVFETKTEAGELYLTPVPHIFGSGEMSSLSAAIREATPEPYVLIHPNVAGQNDLNEDDVAIVRANGKEWKLKVKTDDKMADDVAGITTGFRQSYIVELPLKGNIEKQEKK